MKRLYSLLAPLLTALPCAMAVADAPVDFVKEVRPIFEAHCVKCHGAEKQKGGLRLDARLLALRGGDDGRVIVPGRSGDSLLMKLVAGRDPENAKIKAEAMPPEGPRLTDQELALVRRWIDEGAAWPEDEKIPRMRSEHWSLQPLQLPAVPAVAGAATEIDAFLQAKLHAQELTPAPRADRLTLLRRLTFDLIGLPPTPAEMNAFLADGSEHAYETVVARLLTSPHYGERWGRHWLDIARYTESQGFEYDRLREHAWHYRDYVIKCFNEDKPYDQFMREQIAGDVLDPASADGIIAPSLLVCGAYDQAGNLQQNPTQKKITREEELEDLIGVVGQTFLGLTINCARCHAHKFDPIPQDEYYRMKSVFEGVRHGERALPAAPNPAEARRKALQKQLAAAEQTMAELETIGRNAAAEAAGQIKRPPGPTPFVQWTFSGTFMGELKGGAVVEAGALVLPTPGAYFQSRPLTKNLREKTLAAWVTLADLKQGGGAPISIENANGSQFDAITFGERQPRKWAAGSETFSRTRDLEASEETSDPETLIHMAIVYRADNSISVFRNGVAYAQTYTPARPLQMFKAGDAHVVLGMRHLGGGRPWLTGKVRQAALYDRALTDAEVAASYQAEAVAIPLSEITRHLTDAQQSTHANARHASQQVRQALADLPAPLAPAMTYAGTRVQPEPTVLLTRGDVTLPAGTVTPGALSAVLALEPDFGLAADAPEAQRRLKFADWLCDARNPLPARVMVNRLWHLHFGQGLVASPNDLGVSGARPTHPELLDWLAAKFIASGWSMKAIHRLIVHSAAYQQASHPNASAAARDADNLWLWRFAPRRLEAEAVRDAMLAASGQLNPALGGPSFRPFTITEFNASFYHLVDRPEPEFNRRTVYRANVHSGKDPLLDAFDCPDPSVKTPRRGSTTTPLQALELMNNTFVQRQADALAQRALKAAANDLPAAITMAYRLTLGRLPTEAEMQRANSVAAARSLASVCWALLNSTEFVYVR